MSGIATAVVGSAVIGGIVSRNASKRAARSAEKSTDAQMNFMQKQADIGRADANKYMEQATEARNKGTQQSMDFLSSGLPTTMDFMQQGNVGAQNILAGGMPQIQNAIMGGQVNYDFMQPQQIDYQQQVQDVLAGRPDVYEEPDIQTQTATQPQPPQYPTNGNFRPSYNRGGRQVNQNFDVRDPVVYNKRQSLDLTKPQRMIK